CLEQLRRDLDRRLLAELARRPHVEPRPRDDLRREPGRALAESEVEHAHEPGVVEAREQRELLADPCRILLTVERPADLERDLAPIQAIEGPMDGAHAAATEPTPQLEARIHKRRFHHRRPGRAAVRYASTSAPGCNDA